MIRTTAAELILPRFRTLTAADVTEKSPGEVVTEIDHAAETLLSRELRALMPGSLVVGEEGVAADPSRLDLLLEDEPVWLVDPLDGTANFIAGDPRFAVMVALVERHVTLAAWIYSPIDDTMAIAELGGGAHLNGTPIRSPATIPTTETLFGGVSMRFLPPDLRDQIESRRARVAEIRPPMMCAGAEYPAVAQGSQHFAMFWRTLPWDHAPGALLLTEAGGHAARLDGAPYSPVDRGAGILLAQNEGTWDAVRRALLD